MAQPIWAPSVADVGALLRSRTKNKNGLEVGTFTADTRPTDAQVVTLATQAVSDVVDVIGQTISADLYENARSAATYKTAMLVELTFYPEQVGSGRSAYTEFKQLMADKLKALMQAVEYEGGQTPGSEYMVPAGAFGGPPVPIQWWTPW